MTILYALSVILLMILAVHRLTLLRYLNKKWQRPTPSHLPENLPYVTVQLPIYNERFVALRLLKAVSELDYPHDRFEIQVLDDSTDDTTFLLKGEVDRLLANGLNVHVLHRESREGFKAGALEAGLRMAKGEYILMFDADFVPPPSTLKRLLAHFDRSDIGMVQARWGHLNQDDSWLTRAQALMLDAHFHIEHTARSRAGWFFNFNGTAGLWRAKTIREAGGWSAATLTEDLDLSYRAQLAGWKFRYDSDVEVPAELPSEISALKTQQFRWAKGSSQAARALIPKILRTDLKIAVIREALFHLTANWAYVCVALTAILSPWVWWAAIDGPTRLAARLFFFVSTVSLVSFFACAAWMSGRTVWRTARDLAAATLLGIGLSVHNAVAVLEGMSGRASEFHRTPKTGGDLVLPGAIRYSAAGPSWIGFEAALALQHIVFFVLFIQRGDAVSAVFSLLFGTAFSVVAIWSAKELWSPVSIKGVRAIFQFARPSLLRRA